MADEPNNQQSISDDQELAKVLAGVSQQVDSVANEVNETSSTVTGQTTSPTAADNQTDQNSPVATNYGGADTSQQDQEMSASSPAATSTPDEDSTPQYTAPMTPASSGELDGVKQEALNELRPLVDKLNVSPEEKFDTYLLILRSTDDKDLIAPAHEAAKNIADEARRAQALLDIIKEIDFLSQNK